MKTSPNMGTAAEASLADVPPSGEAMVPPKEAAPPGEFLPRARALGETLGRKR